MTRDLGRAYRELEDRVRSDVVAPHPGEILVRARARPHRARRAWVRHARRVVGFTALAAAVPVALGLLLVLLPRPGVEVAPSGTGPSIGEEEWADPPARRDDAEVAPSAPASPSDGVAVIPPGPVQAPPDPPETIEVTVWFQTSEYRRDGCRQWAEVTREVEAADPLRGTLEAVLAGPTEEEREEDGLVSVYGVGGVPTEAEIDIDEDERRVWVDFPDLYQVDYSELPQCRSQDLREPVRRALRELAELEDQAGVEERAGFDGWRTTFLVEDSNEVFRAYVDEGLPIEDALERRR